MKKNLTILTVHGVLRLIPIVALALFMIAELFLGSPDGRALRICCMFQATGSLLLLYPFTREEHTASVIAIGALCAYYLAIWYPALLLDDFPYFFSLPAILVPHAYCSVRLREKYRRVPELFRRDAAWCCAEEDARSFYLSLHTAGGVALAIMLARNAPKGALKMLAVWELALAVLLYVRAYSGRTLFIGRNKERKIQFIITTEAGSSPGMPEIDENIVARVYKKVQYYMKTRKPFLSDKFTLNELADTLKINKVYISKAINKYSGLNFRGYVNRFRVAHSVELMNEDPWLKVIELTFMSGFHSVVTYNMAFRMFMDESPSDMLSRLRLSRPKREVSRTEAPERINAGAPSLPDARN